MLHVHRYIELNPVRARMVEDPAAYPWSSYRINGKGESSDLCTPHTEYMKLGSTGEERICAYQALFGKQINSAWLAEIRDNTNRCPALGNDKFKLAIEQATSRRVRPGIRGRPPAQQKKTAK